MKLLLQARIRGSCAWSVVREAWRSGRKVCVSVVACEIPDTLHEERALGRFRDGIHE